MNILYFCCLLGSFFNLGHPTEPTLSEDQLQALEAIATRDVPAEAPGIATAVIWQGKVVYQKVAGLASLEDSLPITSQSRFNLASNGKQFTALGLLLLAEDGRLGLDDDFREYLPELYTNSEYTVTLRHLLTHTSGMRDIYDLWRLQGKTWWKEPLVQADFFQLMAKQEDLNFVPGSQYAYSNTNYILLAEIISRVSGQPFEVYMANIFQRLGMPNTHFGLPTADYSSLIAKPYFNFNTWRGYNWNWTIAGDGNLFSSLDDQVRWEQLLQGKGTADISAELLGASQQLLEDTPNTAYGYGLEFGEYRGIPYRFHEGATGAWKATVVRFADPQFSIITFTNSGKVTPNYQTRAMADVLLNLPEEVDAFPILPPASDAVFATEELPGMYLSSGGYYFQLTQKGDDLILSRDNRGDVVLARESPYVFHEAADPAFKQAFALDAEGNLTVTAYYPTVPPFTLTKPRVNWQAYPYQAIEGSYLNVETGSSFQIEHVAEQAYQVQFGEKKRSGILIKPGQMMVAGYMLWFDKNTEKVEEIRLQGKRVRNVAFMKQ